MATLNENLQTHCTLHWWNGGKKTLSFKGTLEDLLKEQKITFTKTRTKSEYEIYTFKFRNPYGITFKTNGVMNDLPFLAKQFIQMEMCRMGDRAELYVAGVCRPRVNVNF